MSFRVIVNERPIPRDDLDAARGLAVGVLLSVPVWVCLVGVVWWAWATGATR
jgi:hypothetical protein